jgi:hypothetical protein
MNIGIPSKGLPYISIMELESFNGCKLISFRKQKNKKIFLFSLIYNTVATESGGMGVNICITKSILV